MALRAWTDWWNGCLSSSADWNPGQNFFWDQPKLREDTLGFKAKKWLPRAVGVAVIMCGTWDSDFNGSGGIVQVSYVFVGCDPHPIRAGLEVFL